MHDNTSRPAVRASLHADHRELDSLLQRLMFAFKTNAGDEIDRLWGEFESRLLAHMEAEEKYLVPCLRRSHPGEIERLLEEHGLLRKKLLEFGTQLELHLTRLEIMRSLASALHAHASHEDRLYEWADSELAGKERSSLFSDIAHLTLSIVHR